MRVVRNNRAAEQWLGVARGELLGKTAYDLLPRDAAEHACAEDRQVLQSGVAGGRSG